MILQSSITELKSRLDIVDVIGNSLELKKAGSNYKAICPFHDEKSGSFTINPTKQYYHCFGCSAHGDSISFVKEYHKLSYPEAIERLASDFNFTLEYENHKSQEKKRNVLEVAATYMWYARVKKDDANKYLQARGLNQDSIKKWGIGYASRSNLQNKYYDKKGISHDVLVDHDIYGKSDDGRTFPRFRQRIMFPIHNEYGAIVGFGGRIFDAKNDDVAKYLNSPQSDRFDKSRILYGLDKAKDAIAKANNVVVSEGYLDVILQHQIGIEQSVATLGTAFTEKHLRLIPNDVEIILAFDGDKPGIKAAKKAARTIIAAGRIGRIIIWPEGQDPASLIADGRGNEVKRIIENYQLQPRVELWLLEMEELENTKSHSTLQESHPNSMHSAPVIEAKSDDLEAKRTALSYPDDDVYQKQLKQAFDVVDYEMMYEAFHAFNQTQHAVILPITLDKYEDVRELLVSFDALDLLGLVEPSQPAPFELISNELYGRHPESRVEIFSFFEAETLHLNAS